MSVTAKLESTLTSVHKPSAKDFELLRKADAGLEKQLSNLSLIRLALLVVITFLFASAMHRRNDDAIQKTIGGIYNTANKEGEKISTLDPISTYLFTPYGDSQDTELETLVGNLKAQYAQVFTVKFSVLGTDLSFDLRLIIVSFPLWLSLAQIYVSIVREKRRLLRFTGYTLTTRAGADQITAIDKLLFGREEGPYRSYPGVLIDVSFWVVVVVLVAMMIWITDMHTAEDQGESLFINFGLVIMLVSAFYASAFSSRISTRLREQLETQLGCVVPLDTFGRIWRAINRWLISLPARVKPRLTLVAAGVLTLSTLVLQTAQVGCNDNILGEESRTSTQSGTTSPATAAPVEQKDPTGEGRPGYKLLIGAADWPPSLIPVVFAINSPENLYGRIIYAFSLFLALLGFGLAGLITLRRVPASAFVLVLSRLCAALSSAFVCEFANPTLLFWRPWVWLCPLLLTVVLFIVAKLARRKSPQGADAIYRALRMGYVSLIAADLVYLGSVLRTLPGLVVLFLAVHLMTVGYFSAREGFRALTPSDRC